MDKYRRDDLAVRKFVGKTAVRVVLMVIVVIMVFLITQTPVFTNEIAMKQMENSNEWFVAMSAYQKFASATGIFGRVFVSVTLGFIGWDGYKLAKILNSDTEKSKGELIP